MEPIHIRFEFPEAVYSKKLLLASELSFLKIIQKTGNFKELRKKELKKKAKLKAMLSSLNKSISLISKELPKTKETTLDIKLIAQKTKRSRKTLEDELRDIKRQLERLNSV